jgi:hypothetical protein
MSVESPTFHHSGDNSMSAPTQVVLVESGTHLDGRICVRLD